MKKPLLVAIAMTLSFCILIGCSTSSQVESITSPDSPISSSIPDISSETDNVDKSNPPTLSNSPTPINPPTLSNPPSSNNSSLTEVTEDDCIRFSDYLESNLSDTDYAYIDLYTSRKDKVIWITNQEKFDAIVALYTGKIPEYKLIISNYSKNDIDKAIEELSSTEIAQRGFQQKKIAAIRSYQGFMDIALLSSFPEFEEYAVATYGEMVRIRVVEVNPTV